MLLRRRRLQTSVESSGDGDLVCRAGYQLYFNDDCLCVADADTPCCLPHARADAGH